MPRVCRRGPGPVLQSAEAPTKSEPKFLDGDFALTDIQVKSFSYRFPRDKAAPS